MLGLSISASARPYAQGTVGLYLAEGGNRDKVLGITCPHVLFGLNETVNAGYVFPSTNTNAPRKNVQLLGTRAFEKLLTSIKIRIGRYGPMVGRYEDQIEKLQERVVGEDADDVREAKRELKKTQVLLDDAGEAVEELEKFHERVKRDWGKASLRVIGHILRSPAISVDVDPEGFIKDYAVFELEKSKFERAFRGNVIDPAAGTY